MNRTVAVIIEFALAQFALTCAVRAAVNLQAGASIYFAVWLAAGSIALCGLIDFMIWRAK